MCIPTGIAENSLGSKSPKGDNNSSLRRGAFNNKLTRFEFVKWVLKPPYKSKLLHESIIFNNK